MSIDYYIERGFNKLIDEYTKNPTEENLKIISQKINDLYQVRNELIKENIDCKENLDDLGFQLGKCKYEKNSCKDDLDTLEEIHDQTREIIRELRKKDIQKVIKNQPKTKGKIIPKKTTKIKFGDVMRKTNSGIFIEKIKFDPEIMSWNDFRSSMKGSKKSMKELSEMYSMYKQNISKSYQEYLKGYEKSFEEKRKSREQKK